MTTSTEARTILQHRAFHLLIIVAVAFLCYSNTFHVPFLFDDDHSIVENPAIQSLHAFFGDRGYAALPNRVITYFTFALNYHFGGTSVVGYHAVNLAIHAANGILIYALLSLTLKTPLFTRGESKGAGTSATYLPFLVALLFVSHPVQTQAVTYIVQRLTSLCTFFFLLSLLLHVRWRVSESAGDRFFSPAVFLPFAGSLLAACAAMKTKEIAFTLPFAILLYEFAFYGVPKGFLIPRLLPIGLTAGIIPLTMLNLTKPAAEILSDVHSATHVDTTLPRCDYLFTQFNVIVTYLRLLFFPVNQNLDYDYPISHVLFEPGTLFCALLLLALMVFAGWLWRKGCEVDAASHAPAYARMASFGIAWFFLTLAVESSVIPILDVIFEHRIYLPSAGFFTAAIALVFMRIEQKGGVPSAAKGAAVAVAGVALLYAGATFNRNFVWQSGVMLWEDVARKSPEKSRPHVNLGTYYGEMERAEDSLREFEIAAKIAPQDNYAQANLVLLYVVAGRNNEASGACTKLHQADPQMQGDFKLYQILKMQDNGNPALRAVRSVCSAFK